ncbi:MAG: putative porin [Cyclobacteriaceae bacterium]
MKNTLFIVAFFMSLAVTAQIVDDSSKLVYSAKTTEIIYEYDVKNNFPKERHPDTTLYKLENFMFSDKTEHYYQDLGNNGTAVFPIFYPLQEGIGKTPGYMAYDPYMNMPDDIKYYDTKSPFMEVEVVFGGNYRSTVDFTYARSADENWSFGFDIHKITSGKQIGFTSIDDRNVQANVFNLYTRYKHDEHPYQALVSVSNMNHNVSEVGGINVSTNATNADLFLYQESSVLLSDAKANDSRFNVHLYHEYAWQKQLQFYHQIDFGKQENSYNDDITSTNLDYYGPALIDETETSQKSEFKELINEIGIKGELASLFYRAYVKRRTFDFSYLYWDPVSKSAENYIGGYSRFTWRDRFNIEANAEYLQTGEYKLIGKLNSELIFGSYTSVRAKAPIFYERYFGNHHEWNSSMRATFSNEIKGGVKVKTKFFSLRPTARIATMNNLIYLDQEKMPQQSGAVGVVTSLGGDFNLKINTNKELGEAIHFENEFYYNTTSGGASSNMRVPPVFYNGRLFWRGAWFKKTMQVEIGVDLHAKSSYYAMDYSPALQHYYLQDDFLIDGYYTADVFCNMKVSNVRVFVKMMHVNQQNNDGYFVTPYYPGEPRLFELGVNWMFYD